MTKLPSFDHAYERAQATGGDIHLLAGNGLSLGAKAAFGYDAMWPGLLRNMQTVLPDSVISSIAELGPLPFETLLLRVPPRYRAPERIDGIRRAFIDAIVETHPAGPHALEDGMACSAARFFDRFSTIFSTNYDLISYWIVMHEWSCKSFPHSRSVSDGFGPPPKHYQGKARLVFKDEWHRHRICYLHGALHLFTDGRFTEKLAYFRGQSLLSQIEERIVQGSYPIFVTDAYARSKSLRIAGNGYLHAVSQQVCHRWPPHFHVRLVGELCGRASGGLDRSQSEHQGHFDRRIWRRPRADTASSSSPQQAGPSCGLLRRGVRERVGQSQAHGSTSSPRLTAWQARHRMQRTIDVIAPETGGGAFA